MPDIVFSRAQGLALECYNRSSSRFDPHLARLYSSP